MSDLSIKVNVEFTISEQDMDDIMVTALEGGINHWCDKATITKEPEYDYTFASEVISLGGELTLSIFEEDPVILTKEKFKKGIERFIQERIQDLNVEEIGAVDAGEADTIVQYAVFGELVFS